MSQIILPHYVAERLNAEAAQAEAKRKADEHKKRLADMTAELRAAVGQIADKDERTKVRAVCKKLIGNRGRGICLNGEQEQFAMHEIGQIVCDVLLGGIDWEQKTN